MQYSRTHSIAEAGLRGLTAGLRGVLEAKRMRREAQTEREHRMADQAYRNRLLALQQQQAAQQHAHQQGTLALQQEELDLQKAIEERNKQLADTNVQLDEQKREIRKFYNTLYAEYYVLEDQWKKAPPGSPDRAKFNMQLIEKGAKLKSLGSYIDEEFTGEEDRRALRDAQEKTAAERAHETDLQDRRLKHDKLMATEKREYEAQQTETEKTEATATRQEWEARERENLEKMKGYISKQRVTAIEANINSGIQTDWVEIEESAGVTLTDAHIEKELLHLEDLKDDILKMENGELYFDVLQKNIESGKNPDWTKVYDKITEAIAKDPDPSKVPTHLISPMLSVRRLMFTLPSYKSVVSRRKSYTTGMSAYLDAQLATTEEQKGLYDIALINAFQKMVDEGVAVHQADVHLIKSAQSFMENFGVLIEKVKGGSGALGDNARDSMMGLIIDVYNINVDEWNAADGERAVIQNDIDKIGLGPYMDFPIFKRQDHTLKEIIAANNPRLGWDDTPEEATTTTTPQTTQQTTPQNNSLFPKEKGSYVLADDGEEATTITQETETFPGGLTRTHITNAAKRVQSNIEKGQPLYTALNRLRNNLKKKKLTDTHIEQIIDKVIELLPNEGSKKKSIGQTIGQAILQPVNVRTNPGRSANHE